MFRLCCRLMAALMLAVIVPLAGAQSQEPGSPELSYRFIVAGHAYGAHNGDNPGLYPKFLDYLKTHQDELDTAFLVLDGDIVRLPDEESWQTVESQAGELPFPVYYVLGNHDDSPAGRHILFKKFGQTFYAFQRDTEIFIVLDAMKERGTIPPDQLEFLRRELSTPGVKNAFIFFHELIWTAHRMEYSGVAHNFGSYNRVFHSNFWSDIIPLLNEFPNLNIWVIAGDMGGNAGTAPAFYEELQHIRLIATGMGEIPEENFLLVEVTEGNALLRLVPLNPGSGLQPLETYTKKEVPPLIQFLKLLQ